MGRNYSHIGALLKWEKGVDAWLPTLATTNATDFFAIRDLVTVRINETLKIKGIWYSLRLKSLIVTGTNDLVSTQSLLNASLLADLEDYWVLEIAYQQMDLQHRQETDHYYSKFKDYELKRMSILENLILYYDEDDDSSTDYKFGIRSEVLHRG